jgi:hypothetical protein
MHILFKRQYESLSARIEIEKEKAGDEISRLKYELHLDQ